MKKLLCLLAFLTCFSCSNITVDHNLKDLAQQVNYFRDQRTHLCYAGAFYNERLAFTNVPCSEEVRFLITGKLD